ncbi:MAG TPA: hypothetical protein VKC63_02220 [Solirubrobacterales bacterium]|nr:hypothetical protein [Solirubrobacterales bacterium]
MRVEEGRLAMRAAPLAAPATPLMTGSHALGAAMTTDVALMLYSSMKHRTQLYLDEGQYRWLRQRAGKSGSIAAAVRELIDAERARLADPAADPLLRFLVDESPGRGSEETSVTTLDRDLYGS